MLIIPFLFTFSVIIIIDDAEAKDFSNVESTQRSITYKIGNTISAEDIRCFDNGGSEHGCVLEPTVANERRGYSGVTESGIEAPYNMTLIYMDEQMANFTLQFGDTSPNDPRVFVNGSQVQGVALNNQNVTEGGNFWTYLSGVQANRIELHNQVGTASNFTVYFPQDNNTAIATKGRTIEGNFLNNFPKIVKNTIVGWYEHFNPTPQRADRLIDLLQNDRQKLYEIALKMVLERFDVTAEDAKKYGKKLIEAYKENNNLDDIVNAIENKVRNATGGSFGAGDNPEHGVRQVGQ